MEVKEYQYNCYVKLFKTLKPFLTDKEIINKIDELESTKNVEYIWSFISTALLMSEREYEAKKIYEKLNDDSYEMFRNILEHQDPVEEFDSINNNCLLDYNNNVICDIARFYMTDLLEEYLDDLTSEEDIESNPEADELEKEYQDHYFFNEANDLIIIDNELNFKELFRMVRNCLAHSNYEVIDENYIRLYNYNTATNKLDLNVVLSNVVVLTILNELNEIQYKDEEVVDNSSSYGVMINESVYQKNKNGILWDALGYYEYLRSDFFGVSGDFVEVNTNTKLKTELIILSILNVLVLYGYNESDNIAYLEDVDFSRINVDENILSDYINARSLYYDEEIIRKRNPIDKLKESIKKYKKIYDSRGDIDNEFFRNLPTRIKELEDSYELEVIQYNEYISRKSLWLSREKNKFILRRLRNSLAHGNIRFEDNMVYMEDWEEDNLTFKANLSIIDLLHTLLDENLIYKIYDINIKTKKISY